MIPINLKLSSIEFPKSNTDNLHRIAISNLEDPERMLVRWWTRKYRQPIKQFDDHTWEELFIEKLEDFYSENPAEIEKFLKNERTAEEEEWDGTVPDEEARARRAERAGGPVDLSKYQKDSKDYSDAEVSQIVDNLGKNLPGSRTVKKEEPKIVSTLGGDEIEDTF